MLPFVVSQDILLKLYHTLPMVALKEIPYPYNNC